MSIKNVPVHFCVFVLNLVYVLCYIGYCVQRQKCRPLEYLYQERGGAIAERWIVYDLCPTQGTRVFTIKPNSNT